MQNIYKPKSMPYCDPGCILFPLNPINNPDFTTKYFIGKVERSWYTNKYPKISVKLDYNCLTHLAVQEATMLEKPNIPDQLIRSRLQDEYRLYTNQLAFLPLGVDVNAAVYRFVAQDEKVYFLKLRKGDLEEVTVAVPQFLKSLGIAHILAPLPTRKGQMWGNVEDYSMILYPFVDGKDGYEVTLSDRQWIELGTAIQAVHTAQVPPDLQSLIRQETYSPQFRESVRNFMSQVEETTFEDPISAKLATFMQGKRDEINRIVDRGDQLGLELQGGSLEFVLCHSDLHAGNLLINDEQEFFIVDWDSPILAPKECDLMFAGAGMSRNWPGDREAQLFYQGYGTVQVNPMAVAYYRYERIIQDIAAFCEEIFLSGEGEEDRLQAYHYLTRNFLPAHLVEIAFQSDRF
jgi:spectinomycin phosphotransferase